MNNINKKEEKIGKTITKGQKIISEVPKSQEEKEMKEQDNCKAKIDAFFEKLEREWELKFKQWEDQEKEEKKIKATLAKVVAELELILKEEN
jgi:hypothetical protein